MKPLLTIFTPTFNRAHTLHLCYQSLERQTCKDFIWLIIDDGSDDDTHELVQEWMNSSTMDIKYHFQENQGMHGAHNKAYELIETELNVCIDSDDYLTDNAVEKIIKFWKKNGSNHYAGMVGLDADSEGRVIGTGFPPHLKESTLTNLYSKHKVKGDKKLIYRSEITKEVPPYPLFKGEKYCPLSYKYVLIDKAYPLLIMDEVICHVEYMEDGSSLNMIHQYRNNPQGFSFFRKVAMEFAPTLKDRMRESIHYVSSSLMAKNLSFIKHSPCKITTTLMTPAGFLLYLYILNTDKSTVMKARR
ncbi:glycosyltransferase family 2 protein [Halobacillus sp. SY10]|uniref:glycosyltransferase family 2 protein n=1 Tax=Halobacillus sp. SY10 TaxID=3381356 RepID=UPI003879B6A4